MALFLAFGFASTHAQVVRQVTDLKWGTPNPVLIRDPDFGPIRVRAFGTFTLRAVDAKALLQELVGTDSIFEVDEVGVLLRSIIGQAIPRIGTPASACGEASQGRRARASVRMGR